VERPYKEARNLEKKKKPDPDLTKIIRLEIQLAL
jgi:hypothetical protein